MGGLVVVVLVVLNTWGLVVVVGTLYQHSEGLDHCRNIPMVAAILALGINWVSPQLCIAVTAITALSLTGNLHHLRHDRTLLLLLRLCQTKELNNHPRLNVGFF